LADILSRFKGQTNVRAIAAMNAISLTNKLTLTTWAMFRFMFTIEIIAEQGKSSVKKQQSKTRYSVFHTADLG
jgi:hypothetical protein